MSTIAFQARPGFVASRSHLVASLSAFVFTALLFAVCHPYQGLEGDSSVYIARILADLDPGGLGRDLMFVNDGQSKFSVFPMLARPLVSEIGASNAALLIGAFASTCWFLGVVLLARALAPGRAAWALVVAAAVLPVDYGQIGIFAIGETSAIPRPFAEAAVMASFAGLLNGRMAMAGLGLGIAVLIHPIMALGGLGVAALTLWQARPERTIKLMAAAVGAAVVALVLGGLGMPVLDRLFTRPDGVWLDMLTQRSPHLFPTRWIVSSFAPLIIQGATIAIAANVVDRPRRRFFVATLVVAFTGLIASVLLADVGHVLIAIQAQFWRATWLMTVIGGCALALCAARLWHDGNLSRVVLALLALGWFVQPDPVIVAMIAGAALILHFGGFGDSVRVTSRHVLWIYAFIVLLMLITWTSHMVGWIAFLRDLPPGEVPTLVDPLRNNLHSLPCCLVAAAWLFTLPRSSRGRVGWTLAMTVAGVLLLGGTAALWDQRTDGRRSLERPGAPPGFAALTAGRSREVLWLDTRAEAWFALGRPQYLSPQQEVSIVFSRPLALEWRRRATLLVSLGLVGPDIFTPNAIAVQDEHPVVTQSALDAFCRQPDAPGAVIMPIERGAVPPVFRDMITWRPGPSVVVVDHSLAAKHHLIEGYGITRCGSRR